MLLLPALLLLACLLGPESLPWRGKHLSEVGSSHSVLAVIAKKKCGLSEATAFQENPGIWIFKMKSIFQILATDFF